ncbi:MAG: ABC-F family ATP-binding cassette domain-containing protein [Deltaproteobacteria bacterium]|jgi:ATP-binding cassette subfamily F protein 3|nr:ABC-F family ATP-binding cassette domain-containing protein [Deltaproteobacteria bacterium]
MLQLKNVNKQFADQVVLGNVDWHVRPTDRVGLCGENGAGKTTLLRLLAGQSEVEAGKVQLARGTTVGYLPQEGLEHTGRDLFTEVRSALAELLSVESELQSLENKISRETMQADLERYSELQEIFRQRGGYTMQADIGRVLKGLGFAEDDWTRPCEHFSGGWQMRIALAKLLLQKPNLLLLDEPTNHLDLPARDWLEGYLAAYPHAVILVSHDRFFLDQVVTRIVEIWHAKLTDYPGNYSRYLMAREERVSALREAKARQDEEIARTEAFINKFRFNANKAALVQSRVKQLEKVERIQLPPERKKIGFSFPAPPKGGKLSVRLEKVSHGYGDLAVLDDVSLAVERGERIALVGANGAGKSTMMRLLAGVEEPREGIREEGYNMVMAYFAQDQARTLDPQLSVLEQITRAAPFDMVPQVRNLLGAFLFHGDDVHKRVSVLSGGERNRLALAILLLRPANLLLLDEPTNHLDIASKEVLLQALKGYKGTLVFVSHDRYFVDALANRVVEVAARRATSYLGNYEDFLLSKSGEGDLSHSTLRVEKIHTEDSTQNGKTGRLVSHAERKTARRQEKKRQKELAGVESRIEALETEIAELTVKMQDPAMAIDHARLGKLIDQHAELQAELDGCMETWEALQELAASGDLP